MWRSTSLILFAGMASVAGSTLFSQAKVDGNEVETNALTVAEKLCINRDGVQAATTKIFREYGKLPMKIEFRVQCVDGKRYYSLNTLQ